MDANGAVALSTTVNHHDVVNLIYGLIFGLSIAIVYIAVFLLKQKQSFRSGTAAYVMFEATACYGVVGILWRILNFEYVGRLGAEEHIYITIGCATILVVLIKKIIHTFRNAFGRHSAGWSPNTEDS